MKTANLLNKLKKTNCKGITKVGSNKYTFYNGRNVVSFHNQDGEAICLHCGWIDQEADPMTDYFPGVFAQNGKQLVNFLLTGSRW